jgi:hypothetical protein
MNNQESNYQTEQNALLHQVQAKKGIARKSKEQNKAE